MIVRCLIGFMLAIIASTAYAGIWSYTWPDGSISYHNNKPTTKGLKASNLVSLTDAQTEAIAKAAPTLLTPKSELTKSLVPGATAPVVKPPLPALTRADIENLAAGYGMTYPVQVTQAYIEAEASKLGMVYPVSAEPDFTLLQRVMVNSSMPCVVLKADAIKPIGGKYYTANISLWTVTKPLEVGVGCY